jgi:metal-responsive CopG/Arc/MetJ family transcriptional regulator
MKKIISIYVTAKLLRKLDQQAKKLKTSRTKLVTDILEKHLNVS